ncbi:hypothetical protein, partial [Plastoroseomonas arctica]|nr:hypothetical protein [Plastoroseomonas arctica]
MKRALIASVALHAGLAAAILLYRALPLAEPPQNEGVALVMLQVEDEAAEGTPAAPAGALEPPEAGAPPEAPPPAPELAEAPPPVEPPPPAPAVP